MNNIPITLKQIEILEKWFIENDSDYFKPGVYKPDWYMEWKLAQDKKQMKQKLNLLSKEKAAFLIMHSVSGEFEELKDKWEKYTKTVN